MELRNAMVAGSGSSVIVGDCGWLRWSLGMELRNTVIAGSRADFIFVTCGCRLRWTLIVEFRDAMISCPRLVVVKSYKIPSTWVKIRNNAVGACSRLVVIMMSCVCRP